MKPKNSSKPARAPTSTRVPLKVVSLGAVPILVPPYAMAANGITWKLTCRRFASANGKPPWNTNP